MSTKRQELGFKLALLTTLYENGIDNDVIYKVGKKIFDESCSFDDLLDFAESLVKEKYNETEKNEVFLDMLSLQSQYLGLY